MVQPARSLAVGFLFATLACQPPTPAGGVPSGDGPEYDLILTGGRIIDGSGNPWFYGDVAIRGERISRITPPGMLAKAAAKQRLDATGRVIAPGFIDIQAQSVAAFTVGDGRVICGLSGGSVQLALRPCTTCRHQCGPGVRGEFGSCVRLAITCSVSCRLRRTFFTGTTCRRPLSGIRWPMTCRQVPIPPARGRPWACR